MEFYVKVVGSLPLFPSSLLSFIFSLFIFFFFLYFLFFYISLLFFFFFTSLFFKQARADTFLKQGYSFGWLELEA